jgi:hypothetical protein
MNSCSDKQHARQGNGFIFNLSGLVDVSAPLINVASIASRIKPPCSELARRPHTACYTCHSTATRRLSPVPLLARVTASGFASPVRSPRSSQWSSSGAVRLRLLTGRVSCSTRVTVVRHAGPVDRRGDAGGVGLHRVQHGSQHSGERAASSVRSCAVNGCGACSQTKR